MAKKAKGQQTQSNKFYTADGVLIKPGMIIYVKPPDDKSFIAHCEKVDRITEVGPVSAYAGTIFRSGLIIPKMVYSSTEKALEAAGIKTPTQPPKNNKNKN